MRDRVALLREPEAPGRIVYSDDVQVVSENGRHGRGAAASWRRVIGRRP